MGRWTVSNPGESKTGNYRDDIHDAATALWARSCFTPGLVGRTDAELRTAPKDARLEQHVSRAHLMVRCSLAEDSQLNRKHSLKRSPTALALTSVPRRGTWRGAAYDRKSTLPSASSVAFMRTNASVPRPTGSSGWTGRADWS